MTKFESIGVERQYDSANKRQAVKSFERSCNACCSSGMRLNCDRCAISNAHNVVLSAFEIVLKTQHKAPSFA